MDALGEIGHWPVAQAELWGIADGVDVAWNAGYRRVEVGCDCLQAINGRDNRNDNAAALSRIKEFCNRDWQVSFSHIYRGANMVADGMASLPANPNGQIHLFDIPPEEATSFPRDDFRIAPTFVTSRNIV
ncbi:hypothetical protein PVK06_016267 [Gossypium arboreum]|uniref:RNase H type-1 domain-containing protein n=1 Tax=Gossypium arboreum TaxID=29729 RepID=A0ABR0PZI7_GOSAR|nr:hypothetical protein PVK06_016267 [Gossypium arboreum]